MLPRLVARLAAAVDSDRDPRVVTEFRLADDAQQRWITAVASGVDGVPLLVWLCADCGRRVRAFDTGPGSARYAVLPHTHRHDPDVEPTIDFGGRAVRIVPAGNTTVTPTTGGAMLVVSDEGPMRMLPAGCGVDGTTAGSAR